jgi:hypothetical protein
MSTIHELLDWFASQGMAGSRRPEYRSGHPAVFVGRRQDTGGGITVLHNAVFVYRTPDGRWRVDRYFFGGRSEGVDLESMDEAKQAALVMIKTGEWPESLTAQEY